MKRFNGKIGPISKKSHRKSGKLYRGSQEVEKKRRPGDSFEQKIRWDITVCLLKTYFYPPFQLTNLLKIQKILAENPNYLLWRGFCNLGVGLRSPGVYPWHSTWETTGG